MADLHTKTHQSNPKTARFLTCFGFSGKNNPPEKKPIKTRTKNKSPSLSWPMFCFSAKKSRTKTVPVDNSDKADVGGEIHKPSKVIKKKSENKLPSRQNSKADRQPSSLINQASRAKTKEGPEPNIPIGNRKVLDPTKTGSSLPGSPTVKPKPNPKTHTKLSHAVSLPVLKGRERVGNPRIHDRVSSKKQPHQQKNNGVVEKLDPFMGMSIIMVTLVIMLIWGRLCAVLCTSAWFYFRFRFRTTVNDNDTKSVVNSNDSDSNSEEYKKKIVLEGLLERNRKVTF